MALVPVLTKKKRLRLNSVSVDDVANPVQPVSIGLCTRFITYNGVSTHNYCIWV